MADTETFQHYQVLKKPDGSLWELGRGAMGVTYKAFDTSLRCNVALKVINTTYLDSEMAQQRFLREARAAAGLSHPNVASVFHLGESGGNYFYAMEFIDGETLEAFVRRSGSLPPLQALQIALQVTRALRAASREGLVHRDIKPANLMLLREDDDDSEILVKVIDFGLAKQARKDGSDASASISTGGFVGTPHFASPEQLEEKNLDVRSDMYSLGVTLWYMLTGRTPFSGSMVQIMSQHLTRTPPFDQLAGTPAEVIHLLEHLLEKDAAKRPQTPSDLRREIESAIHAVQRTGAAAAAGTVAVAGSAAPTAVPDEHATHALTEEHTPGTTSQPTARPLETGVVMAAHYRLLQEVSRGERGTLFQALDIDSGKPVALRVLAPEILPTPERFAQATQQVAKVRAAPHPALLEVYSLERANENVFLTFEWVNGITLLDLLRNRHALTAAETIRLLEPLASAADHAQQKDLGPLDLSPGQALLSFAATIDLPTRTSLLGTPLDTWPQFQPKLFPLALRAESAATWAGQQTIVPAGPAVTGAVRQLALLTYELLGGLPAATPSSTGRLQRPPLAALTERANAVLREALDAPASTAPNRASAFVAALREGLNAPPSIPNVRPPGSSRKPAPPLVVPEESPVAIPTPLPSGVPAPPPQTGRSPTPPPIPTPAKPASGGKSKGPLLAFIALAIIFIFLGVVAGIGFAAWKFLLPKGSHALDSIWPQAQAYLHPSATPEPTVARAIPVTPAPTAAAEASEPPMASPVPFASVAASTPVPATPAPTPDRDARLKELLADAKTREDAGDAAGALSAYVTIAQDYPESDQGLSRVDSVISGLAPLDPDADQRRAQQLRSPMERAAGLGSGLAMTFLGDHLVATEPETAADWYRKAADKGEPKAMFALGNLYFKGIGVSAQPAEAARWFGLASDKGYVQAKIYLAECYTEGKGGVSRDYNRAFALLNEALNLDPNSGVAMEKLAIAYERGHGTSVDSRKAFSLTKRAVELGDANAMANLGVYYMKGYGERADPRAAVSLFKQGAEKNNPASMYFYAQCLENGIGGLDKNRAEATGYYRAAAERGFPLAIDWCQKNSVTFTPAN
jgi:serine/threonine protein kinase/TPR repeat protein